MGYKNWTAMNNPLTHQKKLLDKQRERESRYNKPEPNGELVNISKTPHSLEQYVDPRVKENPCSVAEQMIAGILDTYSVRYIPEMTFLGLQLPTHGYPRYDYYLPDHKLCIEYDGQSSHNIEYQIMKDRLKDKFCKEHGINIVRYDRRHFYHLEQHIALLMKQYGIQRRL